MHDEHIKLDQFKSYLERSLWTNKALERSNVQEYWSLEQLK